MNPSASTSPAARPRGPDVPIEVVALDAPARRASAYAAGKMRRVLEKEHRPVLRARVTLAVAPDPAVPRPSRVHATVDVDGRVVQARAAASTLPEAIDAATTRLRAQLVRLDQRRRRRRRARPRRAPGPD